GDVLVQRVRGPEPGLDRRELAVRIALERDEEEPGVELARGRVDAVRERVAAPEDALAVVRRRRREPDVGVERDDRLVVGAAEAEVDLVVLAPAGERRAADLEAADGLLLVAERGAVPRLDQHPDTPGDEVGAAAEPALRLVVADPDVPAHRLDVV